mmetsp:Transcript_44825/g.65809  ORF Transcript_44825/g.65809 Transcript_44825/m.65809 type:complete len:82 (+) Transcript_44825:177-422(+)
MFCTLRRFILTIDADEWLIYVRDLLQYNIGTCSELIKEGGAMLMIQTSNRYRVPMDAVDKRRNSHTRLTHNTTNKITTPFP